jgi:hypothetical protein
VTCECSLMANVSDLVVLDGTLLLKIIILRHSCQGPPWTLLLSFPETSSKLLTLA